MKTSIDRHERKKIYTIWYHMKNRCYNVFHKDYESYGGRGIYVCEKWMVFENFLSDMGVRPHRTLLDRINNDGPYSPENCRWTSPTLSGINRRVFKNNRFGIKGVGQYKCDLGKFRVQVIRNKKRIINTLVNDFFEACCIAKKYELIDRE